MPCVMPTPHGYQLDTLAPLLACVGMGGGGSELWRSEECGEWRQWGVGSRGGGCRHIREERCGGRCYLDHGFAPVTANVTTSDCAPTSIHKPSCTHARTHAHTHAHIPTPPHPHPPTHTHPHTNTLTHTCTRAHSHTHMHARTLTHTLARTCLSLLLEREGLVHSAAGLGQPPSLGLVSLGLVDLVLQGGRGGGNRARVNWSAPAPAPGALGFKSRFQEQLKE